jgi:hypothetical protein
MADFNFKGGHITTRLKPGGTSGFTGFTYNDVPYKVFNPPFSSTVSWGNAGNIGYTVNEVDIGKSFAPNEINYTVSGTHTLTVGCTKFFIFANGGGRGGNGGERGRWNGSGSAGASGVNGQAYWAGFNVIPAATSLTITVGYGGGGGSPSAVGGVGGNSSVNYNGSQIIIAAGGGSGVTSTSSGSISGSTFTSTSGWSGNSNFSINTTGNLNGVGAGGYGGNGGPMNSNPSRTWGGPGGAGGPGYVRIWEYFN